MLRALVTAQYASPGFHANRLQAGCLPSHSEATSIRCWPSRSFALLHTSGLITRHRPAKATGSFEHKTTPNFGARYLLVCRTHHLAVAHSPYDSCRCVWSPDGHCSTGHSHHFHWHRSAGHSCLGTGEDNLKGLCKVGQPATMVVVPVPMEDRM